jgi:hypothetical protein
VVLLCALQYICLYAITLVEFILCFVNLLLPLPEVSLPLRFDKINIFFMASLILIYFTCLVESDNFPYVIAFHGILPQEVLHVLCVQVSCLILVILFQICQWAGAQRTGGAVTTSVRRWLASLGVHAIRASDCME